MFQQKNCQEKKACLNKYSNRLVFFMPKAFIIQYSLFNIQPKVIDRVLAVGKAGASIRRRR